MKIKRIKWADHPILGNLELDLTNSTSGNAYDTIIFAGENGIGKSTILEDVSTFLNIGSFEYFDYLEYEVAGSNYRAIQLDPPHQTIKDFFRIDNLTGTITPVLSNRNNNRQSIDSDTLDPRHYGCVFSRARSDFKTKSIKSTGTSSLDQDKYDNDQNDDFTSLKQLIVDLQNQDYSEYSELNRTLGSSPQSWEQYYPNSKISRFKDSFDNFFEQIEFDKVSDENGEKSILFSKNGNAISIDKLSTGEKQIVFRGIYLLKNMNNLTGSIIMIDEPEISMHPKWQQRILKYFKDLFFDNGNQIAQLFFATHSDHVVKKALRDNTNTLVLTLENNRGNIQWRKNESPSVLPTITSAETNYLAFDLVTNDYHIELYGWLQDKESRNTVKSCDDFIIAQTEYNPAIHRKTSSFGTTNYESLCTYIRNAIHHPDSGNTFTEDELRTSIELLIELCK